MKRLLLAGVMLLAPGTVFAGDDSPVLGDINLAKTLAMSPGGVSGNQGPDAIFDVTANSGVAAGAVSGNTANVKTTAFGVAGPAGAFTTTNARQTNAGGTVAAGRAINQNGQPVAVTAVPASGAYGGAGGGQSGRTAGTAAASAANRNAGGFLRRQAQHPPDHAN